METRDLLSCLTKGAPDIQITMKPADLIGFAEEVRKSKRGRPASRIVDACLPDEEDEATEKPQENNEADETLPNYGKAEMSTGERAKALLAFHEQYPEVTMSSLAKLLGCSRKTLWQLMSIGKANKIIKNIE